MDELRDKIKEILKESCDENTSKRCRGCNAIVSGNETYCSLCERKARKERGE